MHETCEPRFLDLLWKEQRDHGWSDLRLAQEMEVAHSTISRLKSGQRGVGNSIMFRAAQRFPSIRLFLASELLTRTVPERQ